MSEAPTQEQIDDARIRAAKLGLNVRGRKHYVLDDGKDRQPCGEFNGLMAVIRLREAVARGEPTYITSPCGSNGTVFQNDKEGTTFFVERQEDGELTIEGVRYKKIWGSKTDPVTGETIQFDILEDGSHKETRRFPKDYDAQEEAKDLAALVNLARRVKALIDKGDRAAEKAEQFYKSAGIHIKEIKDQSDDWETIIRQECDIGRSRAYELMAIADGKTTLKKVRAAANERKKVHRAK